MNSTLTPILATEMKVSKVHLYAMRGLYFLNFISLAADTWPAILFPSGSPDTLNGVAMSFWASFSLLMILGVRYPLKMIPLLLMQLLYKSAWILGTYRLAYTQGLIDENIQSFFWICIAGIALNLMIIPWNYVFKEFIRPFFHSKSR